MRPGIIGHRFEGALAVKIVRAAVESLFRDVVLCADKRMDIMMGAGAVFGTVRVVLGGTLTFAPIDGLQFLRQTARLGELQHVCAPGSTVSVANVHGELGAVLLKKCAGRESESERIICDLTGTGAQDAAIAEAVWTAHAAR